MPKIKELLSPFNGPFVNMPQDIWAGELDPQFMDIELLTNVGELDASRLLLFFHDGVTTDVEALAAGIYSKYKHNWQAMWDAIHAEYDIMLTSTMKETRHHERVLDSDEVRALKDKGLDSTSRVAANTDELEYSGERKVIVDGETTYGRTDTTTFDNRKDSNQESGTTGVATVHGLKEKTTGAYTDTTEASREAEGEVETADGYHGVGGTAAAPASVSTTKEKLLPDGKLYKDSSSVARTYGPDGLEIARSGTDNVTTTHGLKNELTKTGSEAVAASGKDEDDRTETEQFTDRKDTRSLTVDETETFDTERDQTGNIKTDTIENFDETFEAEGSSPLRTYQALITEEIAGRSGSAWNFTELVIKNVQEEIAAIIWRRKRLIP